MSGVEAVAWVNPLDVDCLAFEDGHTWPSIYRHETDGYSAPLYSQATVDTLRAQLEAAERLVVAVEVQAEENFQRAEAAEANAARYEWLRNPSIDVVLVLDKVTGFREYDEGSRTGGYHTYEYRAGEELDAAIDAAMSRAKGETK